MDTNTTFKVGDILSASWGYEQTNIDFFQVVKVTEKTATIREIEQTKEYNPQAMTGTCLPLVDQFKENSKPLTRKIKGIGNNPCLRLESYKFADLWDGKPERYSDYA